MQAKARLIHIFAGNARRPAPLAPSGLLAGAATRDCLSPGVRAIVIGHTGLAGVA